MSGWVRQHAKLSLAIAATLIASTLIMLWLQPEAFGLNSLKNNPTPPKAQVLPLPLVTLPNPAASAPTPTENNAPKADALPPPAPVVTTRAEPSIEAPDAAIQAQSWVRAMDPNSFLIQYGTSTTYEKGLDIQRKFPELKGSRIVAAYRPGEKLAHFVIVSGPYNPVTQAYDAAKRSGLPSGSWVRSTRSLLDQLKAPTSNQDTPR
jgi:type IV secretory pathway VirB10-like protein